MLELTPKQRYAKKLEHPKWQLKRLKIIERDNGKCRICDDEETLLHVHHLKYYGENPWDVKDDDLITYCVVCHKIVEFLKDSDMADFEVIKVSRYFRADSNIDIVTSIIKLPNEERYSAFFFDYFIDKKELQFKIAIQSKLLRDLVGDFDEIKAKTQPSNA